MAKGGTNVNRIYWTAVTEATVPCRPRQTGKTSQTPSSQLPPRCGVGSARGSVSSFSCHLGIPPPVLALPVPSSLSGCFCLLLYLFSPNCLSLAAGLSPAPLGAVGAGWNRQGASRPTPHTAPPPLLALALGTVMDSNAGEVLSLISSLKPLKFFIRWLLCSYCIGIQI